jgi:hypothetical protein
MQSEANAPKTGEPTVDFSTTTMPQHTGRLWSMISEQSSMCNVTTMEHSLHLALVDFYLFPRLKPALKEWRFCGSTDIIKNATEELKRLSRKGLQECFQYIYSR